MIQLFIEDKKKQPAFLSTEKISELKATRKIVIVNKLS